MEKDNLKRYIQQHRADFDDIPVPQNILPDLMKRTGKSGSRRRSIYYLAAACATGLLLFSYQFLFHHPKTGEISNIVREHRAETTEVAPLPAGPQTEKEVPASRDISGKKITARGKPAPYRKIYTGLQDSSSVASRIEAVMTINEKARLNHKLKGTLIHVLNTDESSNVRLAALNVLLKYAGDSLVEKHLIQALGNQKDPVIQMELVRVAENNRNPDATKKLMEIADDPYTIPLVREQAFYALMTRQ